MIHIDTYVQKHGGKYMRKFILTATSVASLFTMSAVNAVTAGTTSADSLAALGGVTLEAMKPSMGMELTRNGTGYKTYALTNIPLARKLLGNTIAQTNDDKQIFVFSSNFDDKALLSKIDALQKYIDASLVSEQEAQTVLAKLKGNQTSDKKPIPIERHEMMFAGASFPYMQFKIDGKSYTGFLISPGSARLLHGVVTPVVINGQQHVLYKPGFQVNKLRDLTQNLLTYVNQNAVAKKEATAYLQSLLNSRPAAS